MTAIRQPILSNWFLINLIRSCNFLSLWNEFLHWFIDLIKNHCLICSLLEYTKGIPYFCNFSLFSYTSFNPLTMNSCLYLDRYYLKSTKWIEDFYLNSSLKNILGYPYWLLIKSSKLLKVEVSYGWATFYSLNT